MVLKLMRGTNKISGKMTAVAPKGIENSQVKGSGQDELWEVCFSHAEGATCFMQGISQVMNGA